MESIPSGEILSHYALLAALVAVSNAAMAARRQWVHALGWMANWVLALWVVSYTSVVPQWGIGSWSKGTTWLIMILLDVALLLLAIAVYRWRRAASGVIPDAP